MTALLNFNISVTIASASPQPGAYFSPQSNAVTISQLRCKYTIEKSGAKHPNACTLEIYNLAEDTRAAFTQKGLVIDLLAGYGDELKRTFSGDILYASSVRENADWVTKIQLGDGVRAYNYARVKRTYPAGTTYRVIVADIAGSMDLDLPTFSPASETLLATQVPSSVSLQGPAQVELSRYLRVLGMGWSIQDGVLVVLRPNEARPNEALEINEDDGRSGRQRSATRTTRAAARCSPSSACRTRRCSRAC